MMKISTPQAVDSFTLIARRYMAEILPIRRQTLSNQSINQSINQSLNELDDLVLKRTNSTVYFMNRCIINTCM